MANIGYAAFVDVETTGLKPPEHEIIELAIVLFSFDENTGEILNIEQEYDGLREPRCKISPIASRVHGLKIEDVTGYSLDDEAIKNILSRASFIVAHNAKFDYPFCIKYLPDFARLNWHCSLEQILWNGPARSLDKLLTAHGLTNAGAHRALNDVKATLQLLQQIPTYSDEPYFQQILNIETVYDAVEPPKKKKKKYWHWFIILPFIFLIIWGGWGALAGLLVAGFIHWRGKKAAYSAEK